MHLAVFAIKLAVGDLRSLSQSICRPITTFRIVWPQFNRGDDIPDGTC